MLWIRIRIDFGRLVLRIKVGKNNQKPKKNIEEIYIFQLPDFQDLYSDPERDLHRDLHQISNADP